MAGNEIKINEVGTDVESELKTLQSSYDFLYAKYVELMDEMEEKNQPVDKGESTEVTVFNAEVTCDDDNPGYVYFRIDEDMTEVKEVYVDVYPVDYRSPVTI